MIQVLSRFLLVVGLLIPVSAWAAVTFDSTFEKGFNTGVAHPRSFVSNAGTVAGTVGSNNNRALFCFVAVQQASSLGTVSATWNGVSMTLIASATYRTTTNAVFLFGLLNPATGNQTLSVDWTDPQTTVYSYIGCVSVYNVDQGTGWQNGGTDTGTGTTANSTVTSANGNMAIVGHGNNNASSTVKNAGLSPAPTDAWIDTSLSSNSGQQYLASVSGSTVLGWTLGSSVEWGNAKVDVIAAASGSRLLLGVGQ